MENNKSTTDVNIVDGFYGTIEELLDTINFSTFQYGVYRKTQLQDYIKKKREQLKDDEEELTEFNRLVDLLGTAIKFDYIKVLKRV